MLNVEGGNLIKAVVAAVEWVVDCVKNAWEAGKQQCRSAMG